MPFDISSSLNYLPFKIQEGDSLKLLWLKLVHEEINAPFYQEEVSNKLIETAISVDSVVETDVESLDFNQFENARLSGLIFHMSRCGSTLLSNMIRPIPRTIIHSEPRVIEEVFRLYEKPYRPEFVDDLLKKVFETLGRKQKGDEINYVLKLTSYSALGLPIILKLFPSVKRVFLFREPVEVLSSNLSDPDQFWLYSNSLLGLSTAQIIEENTVLENCAQALKRTCESFLENYDENCLIINYADLISQEHSEKVLRSVLSWFEIVITPESFDLAFSERTHYSKDRKTKFKGERESRYQGSEKLHEVAEKYLGPVHKELLAKAQKFQ